MPPAEFGYAGPRVRLDKCSYFSEFFLAEHTLIPEIFEVCEPVAPILASRSAKSANSVTAHSGHAAAAPAMDLPPKGGKSNHPGSHEHHQQEQIADHSTSSRTALRALAAALVGSASVIPQTALWQGTATAVQ